MMENKQQQVNREKLDAQKPEKKPTQPEEPIGNITSSNDSVRLPDHVNVIPPEEQTKGNP